MYNNIKSSYTIIYQSFVIISNKGTCRSTVISLTSYLLSKSLYNIVYIFIVNIYGLWDTKSKMRYLSVGPGQYQQRVGVGNFPEKGLVP